MQVKRWLCAPQPAWRLEALRIAAPLAIVGFYAGRVAHADDWLSSAGFRVPYVPGDWRQVVANPGLPVWAAWTVAIALVLAGLATAAGAFTRWSASLFAVLLAYVALADRLAAFTVSKIAPVIALVLAIAPAGARWSVDAWRRRSEGPPAVPWGSVRFVQAFVATFYFSSGLAKARGDWLTDRYVLWTHLHDSYQTWVSWAAGNVLPPPCWTVLQAITLAFELGAPLWLALPWTRRYAVAWAIAMHAMIGLMFGPVIWFSLLMIALVWTSYGSVPRNARTGGTISG